MCKVLPKGRTYRSTIAGRVASAVLQRNKGAALPVCEALNFANIPLEAGSPAMQRLLTLQKQIDRITLIKSSKPYRQQKKLWRKQHLQFLQESLNSDNMTYQKGIEDPVE